MKKIILALDTTNLEEAISITKKVKDKIFTVKLGLEFFNAHGKAGVKKFNELGVTNLLLDLKLKDLPETVYKSIKALDDIKFGFLTIHGQGGKSMIERAKKAASEIKSKPNIMMVTILYVPKPRISMFLPSHRAFSTSKKIISRIFSISLRRMFG